jgi:FkbM family methyltransferase
VSTVGHVMRNTFNQDDSRYSTYCKNLIVKLLAIHLSKLVRQQQFPAIRRLVWSRILRPYVMWRDLYFNSGTTFGARFRCRVSDAVQGRIFAFGVWEPNLTFFVQRRVRAGDIFIDVGANIGYFSILAATLVGREGKVISIEASPAIFNRLSEHVAMNAKENVRIVNAAAAGGPGVLRIYRGPDGNIGGTSTLASRGMPFEADVPADRLSALVGSDLLRARLIKIDVEGAEGPVLQDILSFADSLPSDLEIVAEITPAELAQFGITVESILEQFEAAGFHAYQIENEYLDEAYLESGSPRAPRRLLHSPTEMVDVVFSRIDAAEL